MSNAPRIFAEVQIFQLQLLARRRSIRASTPERSFRVVLFARQRLIRAALDALNAFGVNAAIIKLQVTRPKNKNIIFTPKYLCLNKSDAGFTRSQRQRPTKLTAWPAPNVGASTLRETNLLGGVTLICVASHNKLINTNNIILST